VSRRVSPQNHVEERLSFRFSLLFYCVIVPGPTHISYAHGMHDSLLVPLNTKEPTNFIQTRPNRLHVYIYVCSNNSLRPKHAATMKLVIERIATTTKQSQDIPRARPPWLGEERLN